MTNSDRSDTISHEGIVLSNDGNIVILSITPASGCSGCHVEGSCSLSGMEEKIIEVHGSYIVKSGDKVTILMQQSMGYTALFLGYLLPGIIVVLTLIIMILMKVGELSAGMISLSILIPYYIFLYFLRERINKKFTFTLKV